MGSTRKELSIADVAGWGSALVTFGLVQGAIYLQAYWGRFGLDPFQFVAVGEVALAGLAGIGFVLFLMLIAALVGTWVEGRLASISAERKVLTWVAPLGLLLGTIAMLWLTSAWTIMFGILLTILCVVIITRAPIVPAAVKNSPWLVVVLVMVVYVSIASGWLGDQRAKRIVNGQGKFVATVSVAGGAVEGLSFVGRLGDTYAFWDPGDKAVVLLAGGDLKRVTIGRRGSGDLWKSR